jgi:PPOX class probable F420-dependent enzyme
MSSGSCAALSELPDTPAQLLTEARRGVLATVDATGTPHAVPVCFALKNDEVVSAIDAKPKTTARLARVRNIEANPNAALLLDRWDEDWTRVGWVMVRGTARLERPGYGQDELLARYPQYASDPPGGDVIVLAPTRVLWWTWE